jgi:hypothetical protein
MAGQRAGHDRHASHSVAMFRDRFWWSLAFTMPVVIWSGDIQHWLGYAFDSRWRNRSEFINGRDNIIDFLSRKWAKELEYRLIKEM